MTGQAVRMYNFPGSEWDDRAERLYYDGLDVAAFLPEHKLDQMREIVLNTIIGPEFEPGSTIRDTVTSLHSSGAQGHPSAFHGAHRVIWDRHCEIVATPLLGALESMCLRNVQNIEVAVLGKPRAPYPRFIEMLPAQIFWSAKSALAKDTRWSFESCPGSVEYDDVFVGFVNYNKVSVFLDIVAGTQNFRAWGSLAGSHEVFADSPWQAEENEHRVYIEEGSEDAKRCSAHTTTVEVKPGCGILYHSRLVVGSRYMRATDIANEELDDSLIFGLAYRMTRSHHSMHDGSACEVGGTVPTLYHGRLATIYGPCAASARMADDLCAAFAEKGKGKYKSDNWSPLVGGPDGLTAQSVPDRIIKAAYGKFLSGGAFTRFTPMMFPHLAMMYPSFERSYYPTSAETTYITSVESDEEEAVRTTQFFTSALATDAQPTLLEKL